MTSIYVDSPDRSEGKRWAFEELAQLYKTDWVMAPGILYAMAELPGSLPYTRFSEDGVRFLCLVAEEMPSWVKENSKPNPWEPSDELRKIAREVLVRRVMPQLLTGYFVLEGEFLIAHRVLEYLGANYRHYRLLNMN